ncbi:PTS system glucose-specific IIA component/PTS system N-acetylglucosamine-specific IIA component [Nocardiopsis arvandica]|uniref:PTS system glucose-specific IIA component/PTS system N-acetylglucosamine-specific IIA component n=1 Tax=Nocardiopsis sinuspersici TaxID=501010 RepID=A0A7Y9XCC0_9ACTN|nr:PTS glucose transporter subunit IIA [Nocardiopsis sinuspersici]NYH51695.1 PTS system glucose-specific IIA component/PTS system N-acetylglucosamine-specific IIA component [Nocardiopsis sinuspersici]
MSDMTGALRVLSPVPGTALSLETVPDPVFSQSMVGPGVAVHPEPGQEGGQEGSQEAVSPIGGTLVKLHPHAFVVMAPDHRRGVLVHLGIDTVQLAGEGFTLLAAEGDDVEAGTPVVRWSPGMVAAQGRPSVVPVVALDASPDALGDVAGGAVQHGDPLFTWG